MSLQAHAKLRYSCRIQKKNEQIFDHDRLRKFCYIQNAMIHGNPVEQPRGSKEENKEDLFVPEQNHQCPSTPQEASILP
jgi:hypothetical protein